MAPKSPPPFPLYETKFRNNKISRAIELVILFLLLSLIGYRIFNLHSHEYYYTWLLALICESWFTFLWVLSVSTKWNQVETVTYPDRFLQWVDNGSSEFPAVDMFVTTANPELEPPILTVNTVLSLLALEYPANKLACYVSDDSASPVTFYCLVEVSKFAKLWVPFCKKYNIAVRAPFRYFSGDQTFPPPDSSPKFQQEWKKMSDEYAKLCKKIEYATQEPILFNKLATFSDLNRNDHSTIIKIIWENKESLAIDMPHLIYISREKRPKHQHHYKAGAMNVLTRVSGVMTNAPFMLNVDCDFYVNDPKVVLHAMCFLLGAENEKDAGFVQFPQTFYDGLKDDPYASQYKILIEYMGRGNAGIQGSFYDGTGCFHRRKAIYGLSPNDSITAGKLTDDGLQKTYGKSKVFKTSAANILSSGYLNSEMWSSSVLLHCLEAASQVANCSYEFGTAWGRTIGWRYGSVTEDILTGIGIQRLGWKTAYCVTDPPAFLGCAPSTGLGSLNQMKRWASGHTEILFSTEGPIFATLFGRLQFRQCLAYMFVMLWPVRPIFEIYYAFIPAYCIITNSQFLPKVNEVTIIIPFSIFIIYNAYTLREYIKANESVRAWWNNQRMWRIISSASWLFGFLTVVFKIFGLSETVFEVTNKDEATDRKKSNNGFTFDDSPFFVPGVTILLVNMIALFIGLLSFIKGEPEWSAGEVICSFWVILMFWAYLKGLFGKGKDGIPWSTILKSGALTFLLIHCFKFVH